MTEDERDALIDQLPTADMTVWDPDDELQHFQHATLAWWRDALGHPASGPTHSCCKTCGCAITCTLGAFENALIASVVRELDRIGALRAAPTKPGVQIDVPPDPPAVAEAIRDIRRHGLPPAR